MPKYHQQAAHHLQRSNYLDVANDASVIDDSLPTLTSSHSYRRRERMTSYPIRRVPNIRPPPTTIYQSNDPHANPGYYTAGFVRRTQVIETTTSHSRPFSRSPTSSTENLDLPQSTTRSSDDTSAHTDDDSIDDRRAAPTNDVRLLQAIRFNQEQTKAVQSQLRGMAIQLDQIAKLVKTVVNSTNKIAERERGWECQPQMSPTNARPRYSPYPRPPELSPQAHEQEIYHAAYAGITSFDRIRTPPLHEESCNDNKPKRPKDTGNDDVTLSSATT